MKIRKPTRTLDILSAIFIISIKSITSSSLTIKKRRLRSRSTILKKYFSSVSIHLQNIFLLCKVCHLDHDLHKWLCEVHHTWKCEQIYHICYKCKRISNGPNWGQKVLLQISHVSNLPSMWNVIKIILLTLHVSHATIVTIPKSGAMFRISICL